MANLPTLAEEIVDQENVSPANPDHIVKKTVLITGASSGIGAACVLQMVQAGWHVFATVRKVEDKERLQSANVTPVIMDVQDRSTIFRGSRGDKFAAKRRMVW